jgi:hypothetical protein
MDQKQLAKEHSGDAVNMKVPRRETERATVTNRQPQLSI